MTYEKIKYNFDKGFWSIPMVRMAVKKGIITATQFKEITNTEY